MALYRVTKEQRRDIDRKLKQVSKLVKWQGGSLLDPAEVSRVLGLMLAKAPHGAPSGSTTASEAAAIMGPAFHGVDALTRRFGTRLRAWEAKQLEIVPFSRELLEECSRTHVLVAGGGGTSIMDMRLAAPQVFYFNKAWYADEEFANASVKRGWCLVRRDAVQGSTSKLWTEQEATMPEAEYIPPASTVVLAVILHYLETGERLMSALYVRTDDVDRTGRRGSVGRFAEHGLRIQSRGESLRDYYVGVAGARRWSWSESRRADKGTRAA